MRLIFNHLLLRILDLAAEKLHLLVQQKDVIRKWSTAGVGDKSKYVKQAESIIDSLLRNHEQIHNILGALEESKPVGLTKEQENLVSSIRRVFRWGLGEHTSVVEYAVQVGFNKDLIEGLQKNLSPSQIQGQSEVGK